MAHPSARSHFDAGTKSLAAGDTEGAREALLEALRLSRSAEEQGRVLYNLAVCYVRQQNPDGAQKALKALEERAPDLLRVARTDPDFGPLHDDPDFRQYFPPSRMPAAPLSAGTHVPGETERNGTAPAEPARRPAFADRFWSVFAILSTAFALISFAAKVRQGLGIGPWLTRLVPVLALAAVLAALWALMAAHYSLDESPRRPPQTAPPPPKS